MSTRCSDGLRRWDKELKQLPSVRVDLSCALIIHEALCLDIFAPGIFRVSIEEIVMDGEGMWEHRLASHSRGEGKLLLVLPSLDV